MRTIAVVVSFLAVALFAHHADAATQKRKLTVRSGQEVRIAVHSHYGEDCRGRQKARISFVHKPTDGRATVKDSTELVRKSGETCNGKKVPGKGVFYRSNKGFRGTDRVVYDRKTPTGNILFTIDATITVK